MNDFKISPRGGKTVFRPGETLEGGASWNLREPFKAIEIRLMWFTRGKGTMDANVVESSQMEAPAMMGDAPFRFVLPDGPHSFSGQLIALVWAVEIVAIPLRGKERPSHRFEFSLSTSDSPLVLPKVETPMSETQQKWKKRVEGFAGRRSSGGSTSNFP